MAEVGATGVTNQLYPVSAVCVQWLLFYIAGMMQPKGREPATGSKLFTGIK
jgi:hypothetical protein